jgi:hypothetical protein
MNSDYAKLSARIDALLAEGIDKAKFEQLVQEALRLRPVPHDLCHKLLKSRWEPLLTGDRWETMRPRLLAALGKYGRPSPQVLDASHPIGQAAARLIDSLPGFERWEPSYEDMVDSFGARFGPGATSPVRPQLPPGMAEGRPVAYYRLTAGLVVLGEGGDLKTVADLVADERLKDNKMWRLSDVIDLSWMETRPLQLHEVETLLRNVCGKVLPGVSIRFHTHDEPRYRVGLRLYLGECPTPAATGGVLEPSPAMPQDTAASHVRMYLQVWASVMTGTAVDFRSLPAADLG